MKKILIPIYSFLILSLIIVLIVGSNKEIDFEFYSIKENYSFVEADNRRMSFNVYSKTEKPLISYPERNNYHVKLDSQSFDLENVKIENNGFGDKYLIKITSDVPDITDDEYISLSFKLIINNASYKLELDMGSFSIIDSKSKNLLSLDNLSGSYSKRDNIPFLCGLNLKFTNDYDYLTQVRIGGLSYGILSRAKFDVKLNNEIDINNYISNYNYSKIEEDYPIGLKSNILFIPLGYMNDYLIRSGYIVFNLDGNSYYFDCWPFMTTDPTFNDFNNKLDKGVFVNA